jgi:hypothetical protein
MTNGRIREIEAWWALVARVLAFFLGALLIGYEAVFGAADNPQVRTILIITGVALIGPVVAASVTSMLSAMRGRTR